MKLSSNFVGHSNDGNNFPHKLLLTNTQGLKLRKTFLNDSSANIELSKTQFRKKGQSEGYLQSLLGPLLKIGLPLIGNVLKPLAKSISIPLGLTAAVPAADAAIHKNMLWSGLTTFVILNKEMNDTVKVVKSLEESGVFIKDVRKAIKNKAKVQTGGFLGSY